MKQRIKKIVYKIYYTLLKSNKITAIVAHTANTQTPVSLKEILSYKFSINRNKPYWQVHNSSKIANPRNITIGVETSPGLMPGCYIQGNGKIIIGDYTQIGPSVGIISSNHDIYDNRIGVYTKVVIGKYCWLGMHSVILPGVTLGDFTIVGAGSIVTKSFPQGYVVIAGNPAKIIKYLDKDKVIEHVSEFEYCGFIKKSKFEAFKMKKLNT